MSGKVATNIRLEAEQLKQLKRIAVEKGASLSKLFKEIIADYLERVSTLSGKDWRKDPFFQIGRKPGRSGESTVSEAHDHYLYGRGRRSS
ncbi:MAG: ribbon-helix-helix protein, CopG family [Nitrospirae bacterium]|nr:ribbon-helix-helix protein, CopG family [Nitrospirota bacterium]